MMSKKIFLICSIQNRNAEDAIKIDAYVKKLEDEGNIVHYPSRDTKQIDETGGYVICMDNVDAIKNADEVHVYWNSTSRGSLFDLGASFALNKKIVIANRDEIILPKNVKKSLEYMMLYWEKLSHMTYALCDLEDKNGTKSMTKSDLAKAEKYRRERLEKLLKE